MIDDGNDNVIYRTYYIDNLIAHSGVNNSINFYNEGIATSNFLSLANILYENVDFADLASNTSAYFVNSITFSLCPVLNNKATLINYSFPFYFAFDSKKTTNLSNNSDDIKMFPDVLYVLPDEVSSQTIHFDQQDKSSGLGFWNMYTIGGNLGLTGIFYCHPITNVENGGYFSHALQISISVMFRGINK